MSVTKIKEWLRIPLRAVPNVVSITDQDPPGGTRGIAKTDYTVLAARGGSCGIRLVEDMERDLGNELDAKLNKDTPADDEVVRGSQTWWTYVEKSMVLTMERSVEGAVLHHHCQIATLVMRKLANWLHMGYDLVSSKFCHPRESNSITDEERDEWIAAAGRLPAIPVISVQDLNRVMTQRIEIPAQPILDANRPHFSFSSQAGVSDVIFALEKDGQDRIMYVVEVKATSVMGEAKFNELKRLLREGRNQATLQLVQLDNGPLRVISELGRDLTDIMSQVLTELVTSRTDLGILTNDQRSLVFEWNGEELLLSRQIDHSGSMPLHRLLIALGVHSNRRRRHAPIQPTI
ncbi:hypothetical protein IAT40_000194 [Kwoniella sp. CBS 6097]